MGRNLGLETEQENPEVQDQKSALLRLREEAEENQQDLDSRSYQKSFTRHPFHSSRTYQEAESKESGSGSFYVRTTLCLLIFCGFLWLKKENRSFLGMALETVQEAISQSVVLQDHTDSGKIEATNP